MKLKLIHKRAVLLLVSGQSKTDVANELKIKPQTLSRWFKDDNFVRQFDLLQSELLGVIRGELEKLYCLVPSIIAEAMTNKDVKVRLKAIETLLKTLHKA